MATLEATLLNAANWINQDRDTYVNIQSAGSSSSILHNTSLVYLGQQDISAVWNEFWISRIGLHFDLSELPTGAYITAATLKLDGVGDFSTDNFDITIVEGSFANPPVNADYNNGLNTSFGLINSSAYAAGWNSITVNATGLVYLNNAILAGEVLFFLKSGEDIAISEPTTNEYIAYEGYSGNNPPVLELTYSVFGSDVYPTVVTFPDQGRIDLLTYSVIKGYLEGIDADIVVTTDGDGNIDLVVTAWLTWDGTSEKIAYDDTNSRVTFTTLESTSAITLTGDLVTVDPTITTTGAAVDSTVAVDAQLSDTAYASIKSKITDDELVFSGVSAPAPADDEGDIYMDSTTGDLMLKTRDDGQAGIKTDTLADFSGM